MVMRFCVKKIRFSERHNKRENEDTEAAFGLLDPDGEPKPAYFALKNPIETLASEYGGRGEFNRQTEDRLHDHHEHIGKASIAVGETISVTVYDRATPEA